MSDLQYRGPIYGNTGGSVPFTADMTAAQRVTDAHGRFTEAASRGLLFSTGMTATSISASTFTTAALSATGTPIVGVWNPSGSGKNLYILQARMNAFQTALITTGPGAFMWAVSLNNAAISTGLTPWNRQTLTQGGSVAKGFANTALTGLTNNLTVMESSALSGGSLGNYASTGTAAGFMGLESGTNVDPIDGAFVIPPGGVLALLCTTTPIAVTASSSLLWEELPILT
jgi:hypothetical protein